MMIAVDATCVGSGLGGDETLVTGMLRGLARVMPNDCRLKVLATQRADLSAEVIGHPQITVYRTVRRPSPIHFTMTLPRWLAGLSLRSERPDLVLTNTHAPVWSPAPVVLTVTDLSFLHVPAAYPRATRLRLQAAVRRQVSTALMVLTISEFCRQDLMASYALPPHKVRVIPLTPDPPSVPEEGATERLAARGVRAPYIIYLGNLHPRKNVARSITAFLAVRDRLPELAEHSYVIAGGRWFAGSGEEQAAAAAPPGAVQFLGRVDDAEREVLLRNATALVYLSTFEGFGLPPLEAMARDTPVLAADATAVPEVCGDGAFLVDPLDLRAIESGLTRVLTEPGLRTDLVDRGRARVQQYTLERTGIALLAALTAATDQAADRSMRSGR